MCVFVHVCQCLCPCLGIGLFLAALSFVYFAKAFAGGYMKSSVTQIERRFDIPSSLIGVIDGSFEIGNLLVIAFVSYFGAKLHRPRIIGAGCLVMAMGCFLTAMPHFFQGHYQYETSMSHSLDNATESILPCLTNHSTVVDTDMHSEKSRAACEKEAGSSMWVYVFLGNMLRGIGETPITPLGVSYLDDFSREENTAFYIACIQTVGILGPMMGFMLGSFCAKVYVDIGSVDLDALTINDQDSRWVGAWWLGFLVTGVVILMSAIPFFFLPKSMAKQGEEEEEEEEEERGRTGKGSNMEHDNFLPGEKARAEKEEEKEVNFSELAKDFLPSLRRLFSNRVYPLIILTSLVAVNGFIGMITFKPKYMEQIYGQSASKPVSMVSGCNMGCSCSLRHWDPVCSSNGLSYASPCLAGCQTSTGAGKEMVFHNCTCVGEMLRPAGNSSVVLGQCPRHGNCDYMFKLYMGFTVLFAFVSACGGTPGYIVLLRSIQPDLKSLALGMQTLIVRTLGGIPPPIYFGALIDRTCLKWGTKRCGGRGACRLYEANAFRMTFLGLIYSLYLVANLLWCALYYRVVQRARKASLRKQAKLQQNGQTDGPTARPASVVMGDRGDADRESTI
uniref:Solute carrier organic anion transporter family member n=1 Tax=Gadus morhua TaxID=8049 RepID=A0A8C5CHE2_GADMO